MSNMVTVAPNRVYVSKRGDNVSFEVAGVPTDVRLGDTVIAELTPQEALIMAASLQKYAIEQMEWS